MTKEDDWVVVGKFGRPQGLSGLVRLFSFTHPKENIFEYSPWHAKLNNCQQVIEPIEIKKNNKFDLVKITGFTTREQAALLTNVEILVEKSQLPDLEADEYYWHQLVGMNVANTAGISLGKVSEILATGANDVMVVIGDKRTLIPFIHDDFIINIDDSNNLIIVNWDEGF